MALLRRADAPRLLAEQAAAAQRWSACYAVRLALVLQPRTPLPIALQQISSLVPRDLRRVAEQSDIAPLLRLAAERVLEAPKRLTFRQSSTAQRDAFDSGWGGA